MSDRMREIAGDVARCGSCERPVSVCVENPCADAAGSMAPCLTCGEEHAEHEMVAAPLFRRADGRNVIAGIEASFLGPVCARCWAAANEVKA